MYNVPASITIGDEFDSVTIRKVPANSSDAVLCRQWDLGSPEARVTSTPRTGADGTYDGAGFTGARTVSFDLQIFGDGNGSAYAYAERLAALAHPGRRPTLTMSRAAVDTGGDAWTMQLRGTPFSIAYGGKAGAVLEMQLVFNAPLGYLEGPIRQYTSNMASLVAAGGFTAPITVPFAITPGVGTNPQISISVNTSAPVAPVLAIYGPVTNPRVTTSDGDVFVFKGLTLATAADYVVIDMGAGSVYLNGDPASSVYHLVDFSKSTFWSWMRGNRTVFYFATGGRLVVQFRERRITI